MISHLSLTHYKLFSRIFPPVKYFRFLRTTRFSSRNIKLSHFILSNNLKTIAELIKSLNISRKFKTMKLNHHVQFKAHHCGDVMIKSEKMLHCQSLLALFGLFLFCIQLGLAWSFNKFPKQFYYILK